MKRALFLATPLVAISIVVASVGNASAVSQSSERVPAVAVDTQAHALKYAPEEYFRAFYFGTGPAAADLPDIKKAADTSRSNSPDAMAAQDAVIAAIKTSEPGFLMRFARDVTSGQHLRISKALEKGTEQLYVGLEATDPSFTRAKPGAEQPEACSVVLGLTHFSIIMSGALFLYLWTSSESRDQHETETRQLVRVRTEDGQ